MRVICTAGHVDHGKSSLVRALTGMEPDRLAEEQRRSMTIDIGFAWCSLVPGDTSGRRTVAFVDLRDNGAQEVVVYLSSDGWCGTGRVHLVNLGSGRHVLQGCSQTSCCAPSNPRANHED